MKKTFGLISVVVIAMALTLTITFSGVSLASPAVPPTSETEKLDITTIITCNGDVVESQSLNWEIDSGNLLDNPPLAGGEIHGKIGYNEKMIGSSGTTVSDTTFVLDTGTTESNLFVTKCIEYTQGGLGSLSFDEQVEMDITAAGKPKGDASNPACPPYDNSTRKLEEWKWCICPFTKWTTTPGASAVPASCEEVNAFSTMVVTDLEPGAMTTTSVGITEAPVNLNYKIEVEGTGLVVAGVGLYVEDGRGAAGLGSRMTYKEKSIGYGETVEFTKDIVYKSVMSP